MTATDITVGIERHVIARDPLLGASDEMEAPQLTFGCLVLTRAAKHLGAKPVQAPPLLEPDM